MHELAAAIADEKEFYQRMTLEHRDRLRELEQEQVRANNRLGDVQTELKVISYRDEKTRYQARQNVVG